MTDQPVEKILLPGLIEQNPAPLVRRTSYKGADVDLGSGQGFKDKKQEQVDRIMAAFMKALPSNYVSQTTGPFYTIQFQSAAEKLAEFQLTAQEVLADNFYDYTRSEFLFQIIGSLVFPDAQTEGWPVIRGDLTYRTFLTRMVELLLQGAKPEVLKQGVELLTTATVEIIERGIEARKTKGLSAWGPKDQFVFEVNLTDDSTGLEKFPDNFEDLQTNIAIVLRALKPGHTLYECRNLFHETFGTLFTDVPSFEIFEYHYQDLRRNWLGIANITGTVGETLTDRTLFSDPTRDFSSVQSGSILTIKSGPNSLHIGTEDGTPYRVPEDYTGNFVVTDIRYFPIGDDSVSRPYTTSPTLLSGTATVSGSAITDPTQDWSLAVEGEILTFLSGPNAGQYRLKTVCGEDGGPVGKVTSASTSVVISPSILRVDRKMAQTATNQMYQVEVDKFGVQTPNTVLNEDVSVYFTL